MYDEQLENSFQDFSFSRLFTLQQSLRARWPVVSHIHIFVILWFIYDLTKQSSIRFKVYHYEGLYLCNPPRAFSLHTLFFGANAGSSNPAASDLQVFFNSQGSELEVLYVILPLILYRRITFFPSSHMHTQNGSHCIFQDSPPHIGSSRNMDEITFIVSKFPHLTRKSWYLKYHTKYLLSVTLL